MAINLRNVVVTGKTVEPLLVLEQRERHHIQRMCGHQLSRSYYWNFQMYGNDRSSYFTILRLEMQGTDLIIIFVVVIIDLCLAGNLWRLGKIAFH